MDNINDKIMEKLCNFMNVVSSKELLESLKNFIHNMIVFMQKTFNYTTVFCIVIVILIIGVLIYWYNWNINIRTNKIIKNIDFYPEFVNIQPLSSLPDYLSDPDKFKLCDWYVCSSYKPYLPGNLTGDYCTLKSIELLLRSGVRYIELDIFVDNCNNLNPVVTIGKEKGNWHYSLNNLDLKECLNTIRNIGFSKSIITNSTDPLFLFLNLKVNKKITVLDKVADILYEVFDDKLLDTSYSYYRQNISNVPIKNFMNKIVILSNKSYQKSKLTELINLSLDGPFIRRLNSDEVIQTYQPKELTDFNRQNITIVYPNNESKYPINYNPSLPWLYGCQFVCMNFQKLDENMNIYMEKFKEQSFVLKPKNLRYVPKTYKAPKKQDPKLHYNALQIKNSFYNYKI
jgi:hypothetical protein